MDVKFKDIRDRLIIDYEKRGGALGFVHMYKGGGLKVGRRTPSFLISNQKVEELQVLNRQTAQSQYNMISDTPL